MNERNEGCAVEKQEIQKVCDVMPVQIQKRNRRWLNIFIVIVVVILLCIGMLSTKYGFIRTYAVKMHAIGALDDVLRLSSKQLVSDELIRETVRSASRTGKLRDASWGAREEVFDKHLCTIFSSFLFSDPALACRTASYSVGHTDGSVWYEKLGIPDSVVPIVQKIREGLYNTGRAYLSNPDGLHETVFLKSSVFLDEFSALSKGQQSNIKDLLQNAVLSFLQFKDNAETRVEYNTYIHLESEWRNDKSASQEKYNAWVKQRKVLQSRVQHLDLYLFAGRRFAEGGDALLNAYISILTDIGSTVSK